MTQHRLVTPGHDLHERAERAVADPTLQRALRNLDRRLYTARDVAEHPQSLKDRAAQIRLVPQETIATLRDDAQWIKDQLLRTTES